jgi:hypothetical protein
MQLYRFIIFLGSLITLIAFVTSIWFYKKGNPPFYKFICLFVLCGLLLSINAIAMQKIGLYSYLSHYWIQFVLQFAQMLCIGLFFLNTKLLALPQEKIKYTIIFFAVVQIFFALLILNEYMDESYCLLNISMLSLILSSIYVRNLLKQKFPTKLSNDPSFWIVAGIFFHSCISFPIYTLYRFIPFDKYVNLKFAIFSLSNISLIILYLFIIKSYTCLKYKNQQL